jgi:hypothetical protein
MITTTLPPFFRVKVFVIMKKRFSIRGRKVGLRLGQAACHTPSPLEPPTYSPARPNWAGRMMVAGLQRPGGGMEKGGQRPERCQPWGAGSAGTPEVSAT